MNQNEITVTYSRHVQEVVTNGVYQYDQGLKLCILGLDPYASIKMHYGVEGMSKTLDRDAVYSDGAFVSDIPNILLAQREDILCYVYQELESSGKTLFTVRLRVIRREKPSGYQYTEEELSGYSKLMGELTAVIDQTQTLKQETQQVASRATISADDADAAAASANQAATLANAAADETTKLQQQVTSDINAMNTKVEQIDQRCLQAQEDDSGTVTLVIAS